jgi:2'-5' RNA ligase
MIDPRSPETSGYHLFLEPEGQLRDILTQQIVHLAEQFHGPVFPPHVTLLGPIERVEAEVIQLAQALAAETHPFTLTLGDWGREPVFFRSLYARIEDSVPLQSCHDRAKELFTRENEPFYAPHLSIFYGLPSDEERRALIQEISYPRGVSFVADRIHIYKTEGRADAWKLIDTFNFAVS